jgi:ribosome-binding factor A
MAKGRRVRDEIETQCGRIHEDDGIDPREFFRKSSSGRGKPNRKTAQLCSQVSETISLALTSDFADERLQGLRVVSVEPAADSGQLIVTVQADVAEGSIELSELSERLAVITGRIRSEMAAAITRKRAPRLTFRVLGVGARVETES